MRRRALLCALPAVTFGATTGCTLPSFETSPTARLGTVVIGNDDDEQHLLRLTLALDGESYFDRTLAVEAGGQRTLRDEWPGAEGTWDVTVTRGDGTTDDAVTARFPPEDGRTGCYEVTVDVGADGTLQQPTGVRVGPQGCGDVTPSG